MRSATLACGSTLRRSRPRDSRHSYNGDTLGSQQGAAITTMGTTCIRCSQPTEGVLCGRCRARLRVLLSARAGVRGAAGPPLHWLQAGIALLALGLVGAGLLRQAGAAGGPAGAGARGGEGGGGGGVVGPPAWAGEGAVQLDWVRRR